MPLEDLTGPNKYIGDLVREWPLGIDPFSEGDDHVRGLKNVLRNSFPTVEEARYPVSFVLPPAGEAEEAQGAVAIAAGTTAQRPSAPNPGYIRYNTELADFEVYSGGEWTRVQVANANLEHETAGVAYIRSGSRGSNNTPVRWDMLAPNSAAEQKAFGQIWLTIEDNTAGGEAGQVSVRTLRNGADRPALTMRRGVIIPDQNAEPEGGDVGSGWLNVYRGVAVRGSQIPWAYGSLASLSGGGVYLAQDLDALERANTIEVMLVNARGSNVNVPPILRVGGATVVTSGYVSAETTATTVVNTQSHSDGFYPLRAGSYAANGELVSRMKLARLHPSRNYWHFETMTNTDPLSASVTYYAQGFIDLGATPLRSLQLAVTAGALGGEAAYRYQ